MVCILLFIVEVILCFVEGCFSDKSMGSLV